MLKFVMAGLVSVTVIVPFTPRLLVFHLRLLDKPGKVRAVNAPAQLGALNRVNVSLPARALPSWLVTTSAPPKVSVPLDTIILALAGVAPLVIAICKVPASPGEVPTVSVLVVPKLSILPGAAFSEAIA